MFVQVPRTIAIMCIILITGELTSARRSSSTSSGYSGSSDSYYSYSPSTSYDYYDDYGYSYDDYGYSYNTYSIPSYLSYGYDYGSSYYYYTPSTTSNYIPVTTYTPSSSNYNSYRNRASYYDYSTGYGHLNTGGFRYTYGYHVDIYTYYYDSSSGLYYCTDN